MSYERTPEHRRRQAERIREWRPWEQSTGPRTPEGKANSKWNAQTHGMRSAATLAELQHVRDFVRSVHERLGR